MIKRIDEGNNVSGNLPPSVDEFLQDVAQMYGGISYTDIIDHHYSDEDIRKLNNLRKRAQKWSFEMDEEDFEDYMNTKIVPSVKKIFNKVVKESKSLVEDTKTDWSVKQLAMDVAIKGENAEVYGLSGLGHGGGGQFYRAMCKFLSSQGMIMMGDYIDVINDFTGVYKDNDCENPFTESIRLKESTAPSKFLSSIDKIVSEIDNLEVPLDEGTEDIVFEGFSKLKDAFVKSIEDHISLLEELKDETSPSIRESDAKLINDLKSLIK